MINDSSGKVRIGAELIDRSGQTLREIITSAQAVSASMERIAHAGEEQTTSIEQIRAAITQMDHLTQANAALVEETAAASESVHRQAEELEAMLQSTSTAPAVDDADRRAPRRRRTAEQPRRAARR